MNKAAGTKGSSVVLAIESAIRGGSLALFVDGVLAGASLGNDNVSRAEDLLQNIESMLEEALIRPNQIDEIAVSVGPGSYTGIRIGVATALGLKNSLGTECLGFSVLQTLADMHGTAEKVVAAVPTGKRDVAWQAFQKKDDLIEPLGEPIADTETAFFDFLGTQKDVSVVLHTDLIARCTEPVIDAGRNLAITIGKAAIKGLGKSEPNPVYLRNAQLRPGIY